MRLIEIEEKKVATAIFVMLNIAVRANDEGKVSPADWQAIYEGKQVLDKIAVCSNEGFRLVLVKGEYCEPSQN